MKILNALFLILIAIMIILFIAIVLVNIYSGEESEAGLVDITGAVQSFEVSHKNIISTYIDAKTTERYDDKLFEYLEHIQERRDKTFMKGKVFLVEK